MRQFNGFKSQLIASSMILEMLAEKGHLSSVTGIAKIGNRSEDIVLNTKTGQVVNIEVKSFTNRKIVTIGEKSCNRNKIPREIEDVYQAYKPLSINGTSLNNIVKMAGHTQDFVGMIDFFKNNYDSKVGFSGDPLTPKSGKMPIQLMTKDPQIISKFRTHYTRNLALKKISFLCLVSNNDVEVYHTGYGINLLEAKKVPVFKQVFLDTYGAGSANSTRIATKAYL